MDFNLSNLFNKPNLKMKTSTPATLSNFYEAPQPQIKPVTSYNLPTRGASVTDMDIEAFKPLLYGEVSNRNFQKKQLEADVIFNTALNRQREYARKGKNLSIAEILAMPNQYQAYGSPQYKEYASTTNPVSTAKKKEVDAIVEMIRERVRKGDFKDNTEGAYYYIHQPDSSISYDNLRPLFSNK